VERNEDGTQNHQAAPATERQASLSSDPCEKISNYLNIWRITVSSERALPCPLKPREMQKGASRDAASLTKVNPSRQVPRQMLAPGRTQGCRHERKETRSEINVFFMISG
jgi:hypothetical protein